MSSAVVPLEAGFYCAISGHVMEAPVRLNCTHRVDRESLELYLESGKRVCPIQGCSSKIARYQSDLDLARRIDDYILSELPIAGLSGADKTRAAWSHRSEIVLKMREKGAVEVEVAVQNQSSSNGDKRFVMVCCVIMLFLGASLAGIIILGEQEQSQ